MEFVDRLGDLLAKLQLSVPTQILSNDQFMDRQLNLLSDSVRSIKGVLETPDLVDAVLSNYMDEIKVSRWSLTESEGRYFRLITTENEQIRPLTLSNHYST